MKGKQLSDEICATIYRQSDNGIGTRRISKMFGMSRTQVQRIVQRRQANNATQEYNKKRRPRGTTKQTDWAIVLVAKRPISIEQNDWCSIQCVEGVSQTQDC